MGTKGREKKTNIHIHIYILYLYIYVCRRAMEGLYEPHSIFPRISHGHRIREYIIGTNYTNDKRDSYAHC